MKLKDETLLQIKTHTLNTFPKEMCGFLLKSGEFIPEVNIAEHPAKSFKIKETSVAKYISETAAIIHSHTNPLGIFDVRTPSYSDLIGQRRTNLLWGIAGTDGENFLNPIFFPRIPNNKYLKRPFFWHINDCRTLVKDYMFYEFGITSGTGYDIVDLSGLKENPTILKEYLDSWLAEEEYIRIYDTNKLQKGDILLLSSIPGFGFDSHLAIYTGENVLQQEKTSYLCSYSEIEDRIRAIYRHPILFVNGV